MYFSHLNFLSPEKKNHLRKMIYMQFIKSALEIFLVIICVSAIMLLGAQSIMQGYFNTLATSLTNTSRQHGEANRSIQNINLVLKNTDAIQSIYTKWTPMLLDITTAIPESITLTSLNLDAHTKTYTFAGIAETRDGLFELRSNLENVSFVASVNIPSSQITLRENFPFSFTVTVK